MIKYTVKNLISLIKTLNKTSIKRIIVYFALTYPLIFIYTHKNDLKLFWYNSQKTVYIRDLSITQERCYILRQKYGAESILLYAYQPIGVDKIYKERLIFSTRNYQPLENMRIINLYSRTRLIETIKQNGYAIIDANSQHFESSIIKAYNLHSAVVIPIRKRESRELLGEVVWLFSDDKKIDIESLIIESQIFSFDLEY